MKKLNVDLSWIKNTVKRTVSSNIFKKKERNFQIRLYKSLKIAYNVKSKYNNGL